MFLVIQVVFEREIAFEGVWKRSGKAFGGLLGLAEMIFLPFERTSAHALAHVNSTCFVNSYIG